MLDDSRPIVRVVADEVGGHLPVWFPIPIFDDATKMPVSTELLESLRTWNRIGQDIRESGSSAAVSEHYRVGRDLARRLAIEVDPEYQVFMLMAGDSYGWQRIGVVASGDD